MEIRDAGWIFDTELLLAAAEAEERDWYQRDMLNAFSRYAYRTYKQIRDSVNHRKCKSMTVDKVKEKLKEKINFVSKLLNKTPEEIIFIVDYADKYLEYIR